MKKSQLFVKSAAFVSLLLLLLTASFVSIRAAGEVDPTFNGGAFQTGGAVYTLARQPDGKVLYGGYFTAINGLPRQSLARVSGENGAIDQTFNASAVDGGVYAIVPLPDGKILIGGSIRIGGVQTGVARLNSDGSVDATFQIFPFGRGPVFDIEVLSDGKIVLGGNFSYNAPGTGKWRLFIARLNADGSDDDGFNPPYSANLLFIEDIEVQPDGKIIGAATRTDTMTGILKRYNTDGSEDNSFNVSYTSTNGVGNPRSLRIQPDGKILIGGIFNLVNNTAKSKIARLNADGTVDNTFDAASANLLLPDILDVEVDSNGKIVLTGYTSSNPTSRTVVRLESNGAPDSSFNFSPSTPIFSSDAVLPLPDGKILLAGRPGGSQPRINADGTVDASYAAVIGEYGGISEIVVQPDGKILVAGGFNTLNSVTRTRVGRFNADGTTDTTFNANIGNSYVSGLAVQPDGKILIGGLFIERFMRLNPDGSRDTTFNIPASVINPYDIVVLPNGKILAAGGRVQLLNADGSLDSTFGTVTVGGYIEKTIIQPDGKILIGGNFNLVNGKERFKIARLNQDGSLDLAFNPTGDEGQVFDLVLQADGKIIIGGSFNTLNGANKPYLARLNPDGTTDTTYNPILNGAVNALEMQPNGKLIIGGAFTTVEGAPRNRLARLNADGSLDTTFQIGTGANISINNPAVLALALQSNGKILVGGAFSNFNGIGKIAVVRLLNDSVRRAGFDFDGDGRSDVSVFRPNNGSWYIQQSQAGFTGLAFGQTGDKLVPADYDGDGKTDVAVVRGGNWYLQRSSLGFSATQFGNPDDVPVPADYDGDGKADIAVFRPSNGTWYLLQSQAGFAAIALGLGTDKPVPGDYNGDGRAEVAVFRPSNGYWYLSTNPATGYGGVQFGAAEDKPVPADYDGDGKTDLAVFRPSNGSWYLLQSTAGFTGITFGFGTDLPVPADYDGDGKADIAVFRNGNWYLNRSTQGFTGIQFGTSTDLPIPNSFVR